MMAKIHDLFIVELAEVIKGYGNNPDDKDPFRLSEFYRFYELPNIAVSRKNFEKMRPIEPKQKWIPVSERLPEKSGQYYVSGKGKVWICEFLTIHSSTILLGGWCNDAANPVVQAWMPLPEPYREDGEADG